MRLYGPDLLVHEGSISIFPSSIFRLEVEHANIALGVFQSYKLAPREEGLSGELLLVVTFHFLSFLRNYLVRDKTHCNPYTKPQTNLNLRRTKEEGIIDFIYSIPLSADGGFWDFQHQHSSDKAERTLFLASSNNMMRGGTRFHPQSRTIEFRYLLSQDC